MWPGGDVWDEVGEKTVNELPLDINKILNHLKPSQVASGQLLPGKYLPRMKCRYVHIIQGSGPEKNHLSHIEQLWAPSQLQAAARPLGGLESSSLGVNSES
jgi:hypothetical protein